MLIVSWFICSFAWFFMYDYIFTRSVCKVNYKITIKNIAMAVTMGALNSIMFIFELSYIRPYIIHLYLAVLFSLVYKKSFVKTLLSILYTMIIIFISEMIFGIFAVLVFNISMNEYNNVWNNYMLSNIIIFFEAGLIMAMPITIKIIDSVITWYNEFEYKSLSFFVILILTIAIFLLYNNFVTTLPITTLWIANIFCIGVITFVIGFFREKTNKNKIIYEYDQLLDYVKTYEDLLEEKNKSYHEHKNQLILIRDMSKNKKITNYINKLLNIDDEKLDYEWANKLKYIPQGGLKGLIYYKVKTMLKNGIHVYVDVSEELKKKNVWTNLDRNLQDISKSLGVYLDNAIEACIKSDNKYIIIDVYSENDQIVFSISNTYSEKIDLSKIDNEGYTTKGIGKGYGLSLIKDIINKNDMLNQLREFNGIYYVQKLYIKK